MKSKLRLGISPLSWTNEGIEELGDHIEYETCIVEAAQAGFIGVELGRKFPQRPDRVLETLADVGLLPVTAWHSGFLGDRPVDEEWADAQACIDHLVALGCNVMVYGECGCEPAAGPEAVLADTPALGTIDLSAYAKRVTLFAERVAEAGLTMVYHPHVMMPVETVDEIDRFMSAAGTGLRLLLDTGHIALAGGDYRVVMNNWWDRISHIHLKDIRHSVYEAIDPRQTTFNQAVHDGIFTVPGDGDLDFDPLIRKVAAEGYDGWLIVEAEQDPLRAPPLDMATTAFTHLSGLLKSHNIPFCRNSVVGTA